MNFASDNIVGASAPVLQAIMQANAGAMAAYGNDEISSRVRTRFNEIFEREISVFFVTTGTAANALALSAAVPPYGLCVCHREAHIIDDECGAPEFFMHGAKLAGLPGVGAKLTAMDVAAYLRSLPKAVKQMPPKALSVSQVSECGLVYGLDELSSLGAVCREHGLSFHMDGARFVNALVSLGCTPAEMTWKQGVDILSFGATKNGGLMAEAIVVFRKDLAEALDYRSKRAGQIISKGRLIGAQFEGYFADDHWIANARHANRMAGRLSDGLSQLPGVRLAWPTQANEVFPIIPKSLDQALKAAGIHYHSWTELSLPEAEGVADHEVLIRLVTSWATREEDVNRLLEVASSGVARQAAE
ncbi:low specificity L-threonine aldolase [Microvirga sp. HBU67558]|uniref:threonine aldolase family protein n=1 Tax=Microvirga TaxID=186650 RepID=UPI001B3639E4|nr:MULTISPECIES: low specificity L-threonine aldolase [unclassified Microvirga]MBQ0823990.1 low specificity L-threonine aldolase [Microvirga sp. HBU67558]